MVTIFSFLRNLHTVLHSGFNPHGILKLDPRTVIMNILHLPPFPSEYRVLPIPGLAYFVLTLY